MTTAIALWVAGCGGETSPASGKCDAQAGCDDAGAVERDAGADVVVGACHADDDCDDGVYCNGTERCDPRDAAADAQGCVAAGAPECADDGLDCTLSECDEEQDRCVHTAPDRDQDGHRDGACLDANDEPLGDDCDDADAARFPGNQELCDAHDEDCDPQTFGTTDADGDGSIAEACSNPDVDGNARGGLDCDDTDLAVHARQPEICDGLDNDCDGAVDEVKNAVAWYADVDMDGFGAGDPVTVSCTPQPGLSLLSTDCDDADPETQPAATEACNADDDNCNGVADELLGACKTAPPASNPLPINECANGIDECAGAAVCIDTVASFRCECPDGFDGSGGSCTDVDECAGSHVCTADYPCENLAPDYRCRGQYADWPLDAPVFTVAGGVVTDARSGLQWQQNVDAGIYTWNDAKAYCGALSPGSGAFRLPTRAELESIVNDAAFDPCIDTLAFPNTPTTDFWTSSTDISTPGYVWVVTFDGGATYGIDTAVTSARVRCVRSSGSVAASNSGSGGAPPGRFVVQSNGTVRDTRTLLTWLQAVSATGRSQADAGSYCTSLTAAGGGFRLPTRAELASLVDPTRAMPAIDPIAFPSTPALPHWTSTPYLGEADSAWLVDFFHGRVEQDAASVPLRVRCVR